MHNVVHMQCEALPATPARGAPSASLAAVLTALIPAAAAVSAAVFVHSVGNGVVVHRMIPILRAFGGMRLISVERHGANCCKPMACKE